MASVSVCILHGNLTASETAEENVSSYEAHKQITAKMQTKQKPIAHISFRYTIIHVA